VKLRRRDWISRAQSLRRWIGLRQLRGAECRLASRLSFTAEAFTFSPQAQNQTYLQRTSAHHEHLRTHEERQHNPHECYKFHTAKSSCFSTPVGFSLRSRSRIASPNCETAATGLDFSRPIASQVNRFTSPTGGSLCKFRKQAGIWAVGCRVVRSSVAPVTVPDAHALKDLPGAVWKRDGTDVGRQRKKIRIDTKSRPWLDFRQQGENCHTSRQAKAKRQSERRSREPRVNTDRNERARQLLGWPQSILAAAEASSASASFTAALLSFAWDFPMEGPSVLWEPLVFFRAFGARHSTHPKLDHLRRPLAFP